VPNVNSIDELNQILIAWCEKQRRLRHKDWEQERLALRELPSVPFKCATTKMVSTSRLLLFQYDRNFYSVPVSHGNRNLRIEAYVNRIEVYDSTKLVTIHDRCYDRGEKVMKLEHYLPILRDKPRAAKNALVVRKLPEVYQKLRRMLCSKDPEGYREYAKILLLNLEYRFEDVLLAVEQSLSDSTQSAETVRQILLSKNITQTVKVREKVDLSKLDVPIDSPAKFDHLIGGVA
jgi:hypothetical protein